MQKIKFAAVFLLPIYFLLAGCDSSSPTGTDGPKKEIDSKLVGDWECYKTVTAGIAQEFPEGARMKISFTSDGSYNLPRQMLMVHGAPVMTAFILHHRLTM